MTQAEQRSEQYAVCGHGFNWFGDDVDAAEKMVSTYGGTMYVRIEAAREVTRLAALEQAARAYREAIAARKAFRPTTELSNYATIAAVRDAERALLDAALLAGAGDAEGGDDDDLR